MNYNMRKLGKRALAMVLAIAMMFSLVPSSGLQVYATEETPVETPTETPTETPEVSPEVSPEVRPEVRPEVSPEASPEVSPEETPEASPEVTSEVTPEITPEITPTPVPTPTIPESAYSIVGYEGTYDGQPHSVTVSVDGFMVKYSTDRVNYTEAAPQVTDATENALVVYVQLSAEGYATKEVKASVWVQKATRSDFAFATPTPEDLIYNPKAMSQIFVNTAGSQLESENLQVNYEFTDEAYGEIAELDAATGKLVFQKAGTVEVKATIPESANYLEATASYKVTLKRLQRETFKITEPSDITYSKNLQLANPAEGAEDGSVITYRVKSQTRDGQTVNNVATVDENATLNILGAGTVTVEATIAEGEFYEAKTVEYTLTIHRAEQEALKFADDQITLTFDVEIKNELTGGSGNGKVTYEVVSGEEFVSVSENGTIKGLKTGVAEIKAVKAMDECYNAAEKSYVVTVIKANQTGFAMERDKYSVMYGEEYLQVSAAGGNTDGAITYEIVEDTDHPENNGIANIDAATGKVTFLDGKFGDVVVKATKAGDDNYEPAEATANITMSRMEATNLYTIRGSIGANGWYIGDVEVVIGEGYSVGSSESFAGEWKSAWVLDEEGIFGESTVYLRKTEGEHAGAISEAITIPAYSMDKTAPENLGVVYGEKNFVQKALSILFYNNTVDVTLQAEDAVSGIDSLTYYIKGEVESEVTIPKEQLKFDERKASYSFKIDPQYKGKIVLEALDAAGNKTTTDEEAQEIVVVDNVAPGVGVTFEETKEDSIYYTKNRKATIAIKEANFYEEDVQFDIKFRKNSDESYQDFNFDNKSFVKTETEEGIVYVKEILFTEDGEYTFDISYTDKSGNVFDSYETEHFIIDQTKPVISASYEKSDVKNEKYYAASKEITFTIQEANFDPAGVNLSVKAKDISGADVEVSDYQTYLQDISNWTKNGINYTASIILEEDAHYVLEMTYTDAAGIAEVTPIFEELVIDKSAPVEGTITYSQSVLDWVAEKLLFFNAEVEVTLRVEDQVSEINRLYYTYRVADGVSAINQGAENVPVTDFEYLKNDAGELTGEVEAKVKIPAQFRGHVFFAAYNNAELSGEFYDENEYCIVVDNKVPGISVEFNKSLPTNNVYQEPRYATITIDEANFYAEDVNIEIKKCLAGETKETTTRIHPEFTSGENDLEITEVAFEENATYQMSVSYTDKSGNVADVFVTEDFIVDLIDPVVEVTYDNNEAENEKYFAADRTATIEITEHNFNAVNVVCEVTAVNFTKEPVQVMDYEAYLQDPANWTTVGSVHTAVIPFNVEAEYSMKLSFADNAGREASANYGDSKAPENFIIDKTAPVVNVSYDNMAAENTKYFKADRTVTIVVEEENFFAEDVIMTVGKKDNTQSEYIKEIIEPTFKSKGNVHTATYTFAEDADYTFDISYIDKAENAAGYQIGEELKEDYPQDEFTVDKILPVWSVEFEDNVEAKNKKYYASDRIMIIKMVEHNFDAKDVRFEIVAKDVKGTAINDLPEAEYVAKAKEEESWISGEEADTYILTLPITTEANYLIRMGYVDLAGNSFEKKIRQEFCVDKTAPTTVEPTYSTPVLATALETVLGFFGFNFYKAKMTVTIQATDDIAGVDYFEYSYAVEKDASGVNKAGAGKIDAGKITYAANKATASFKIDPQYRGTVWFAAYDKAGNKTEQGTEQRIVVDNIAPVIDVTFADKDTASYSYNGYYKANRTATIQITEANFFAEDVYIKVSKRLDNETAYTETRMHPEFVKNGDVYTAKLSFAESADYKLSVSYTDKSGNQAKAYGTSFTVDKIAPVVTFSYDNNQVLNSNQFKADRTATIEVVEHNFNVKDVVVTVTAKDLEKKDVEVADYAAYLSNKNNWKKNGNTYTATMKFTEEADYEVRFSYKDMAGNTNKAIQTGDSAAPLKFTLDKTIPTASIQVGTWTQSVKGYLWDHFVEDKSFGLWTNSAVKVTVSNKDELSGIDVIEHFRSPEILSLEEVKAWTNWINVDETKRTFDFTVNPDEQFIVYVHIVDKAGNELYLSSDGVILDKTLPSVEKVAPEVTLQPKVQPVNGIYNTNVLMDVRVIDPIVEEVYSGLKSITYEVYNKSVSSEEPTQSGTLLEFDIISPKKEELVQLYEKDACITVDRNKNNSNEVVVKMIATDNSGNVTTKTCDLKIDITEPTIDISYSNNVADKEVYFKEDRTAEIVITERNFDPDDVKIDISNTEGAIPRVSDWKKSGGSGNGDNTTWTAYINYSIDGDYTFDIRYADMAGNQSEGPRFAPGTVAAKAFTIDKTLPTIEVVYDNNSAMNGNYYKDTRVATITIHEHNFDEERVVITMTATDDGASVSLPGVSGWSSNDDYNVATITYSNDALYTFDIEFMDLAGNYAEEFVEHEFYVDKTMPTLEITGVEDSVAYAGDILPVVTYSDTNYDPSTVSIKLTGAVRGDVKLDGAYADIPNGRTFIFKNLPEEKAMDDIYTLTAELTDKAGNTTTETVVYSANRFGSNYELSDPTRALVGTYVQEPEDVVITEINPSKLSNIKITLFKDNETIVLEEGRDYKIDVTGGNGQWYRYTYTIFKSNFTEDAVYRITIYSEDETGNVSENTLDTKNTNIYFGVDNTDPLLNVTNLESNTTYPLESLDVIMTSSDNLLLNSITVYLDDYENPYVVWDEAAIAEILSGEGEFHFEIPGTSKGAHKVKVVARDAAGNEMVQEFVDFYVTTDLWVRFYNDKPLFYGSIGGTSLGLGGILWLLLGRRKKEEEAQN